MSSFQNNSNDSWEGTAPQPPGNPYGTAPQLTGNRENVRGLSSSDILRGNVLQFLRGDMFVEQYLHAARLHGIDNPIPFTQFIELCCIFAGGFAPLPSGPALMSLARPPVGNAYHLGSYVATAGVWHYVPHWPVNPPSAITAPMHVHPDALVSALANPLVAIPGATGFLYPGLGSPSFSDPDQLAPMNQQHQDQMREATPESPIQWQFSGNGAAPTHR